MISNILKITRKDNIILTKALFSKKEEYNYEDLGIKQEEELEACEFRFNINQLSSYNPSSKEGQTTLRMSNGNEFRIDVPFEEFDNYIIKIVT